MCRAEEYNFRPFEQQERIKCRVVESFQEWAFALIDNIWGQLCKIHFVALEVICGVR